jgi:hypothetical protein
MNRTVVLGQLSQRLRTSRLPSRLLRRFNILRVCSLSSPARLQRLQWLQWLQALTRLVDGARVAGGGGIIIRGVWAPSPLHGHLQPKRETR